MAWRSRVSITKLRSIWGFDTNKQSKQAALEAMPSLSRMYSIDDSIFEVFYINNAEATLRNMKGDSKTIKFYNLQTARKRRLAYRVMAVLILSILYY